MKDIDPDYQYTGPMSLNTYQAKAEFTAVYRDKVDGSEARQTYTILGTAGEAGELSNLWKKYFRDGDYMIDKVVEELGDILWYIAMAAEEFGYTLEEVAHINLDKLARRKQEGTIHGHDRDSDRA